MKTVVGVFSEVGEAQRTIDELIKLGFGARDISVVAGPTAQKSMRLSMSPVEAADAGNLVACGPLADVMRGAGRGALTGSLRYFGLSPELAAHYTNAVRKGETLESLVVEDKDADRVVEIMSRHAARNDEIIEKREKATIGAIPVAPPAPKKEVAPAPAARQHFDLREEERKIPIIREELRVGKREVERGHVHVSVHVTERPISERISLREEHVDVERRPVSRAPLPNELAFKNDDIDITEYAEEPVVSKEVRVVEEVVVHKKVTGHDEVIKDKLRSTEVDVGERLGDRNVFKKHFDTLGGGGNFEEHVPAYELGRSLRTGDSNRWEDVESTARQRWEAHKPGTWERFKESIKYAWHNATRR